MNHPMWSWFLCLSFDPVKPKGPSVADLALRWRDWAAPEIGICEPNVSWPKLAGKRGTTRDHRSRSYQIFFGEFRRRWWSVSPSWRGSNWSYLVVGRYMRICIYKYESSEVSCVDSVVMSPKSSISQLAYCVYSSIHTWVSKFITTCQFSSKGTNKGTDNKIYIW